MKIKRTVAMPILVALIGVMSGGWLLQHGVDPERNVYFQARLFEEVVRHVSSRFVDDTNPDRLYRMAIDGMLNELGDPHSTFMTPEDYERLRLQTQGEYGGLGIEIDVRDGWLTVLSPLPNSPAERVGLRAGDRIIQVEGESTRGWSTDHAVSVLRGPKGSQVRIEVARVGIDAPIPFEITRGDIELTAVPAAYMMGDEVGYIELTTFSETATDSLRAVIDRLQGEGMTSLVLDMRRNTGGLLDQGMMVADLFLERRQLVLETRGRTPDQNHVLRARTPDAYPELELAILIGQRSASATEIVAGALQDHDRAILVGETTFGKGSVQTLFQLPGNNMLKLTTARWYTPSGRSIQKPFGIHGSSDMAEASNAQDAERAAADAARSVEEKLEEGVSTYRTSKGRTVVGGGGITPDLVVADTLTLAEQRLVQAIREDWSLFEQMVYRYAVAFAHQSAELRPGFEVTQDMLDEFYQSLSPEGIEVDREAYDEAAAWVARRLAYEISVAKFSREEGWKRLMDDDPRVRVAADLLRAARSTDEAFELLPAYAEAHGLTLGSAVQLQGNSSRSPHP
jgi:carboxyl-terminal processing protease